MIRSYKRSIARANMERAGVKNINRRKWSADKKGDPVRTSMFAENWRKWTSMPKKAAKKIKREERNKFFGRMAKTLVGVSEAAR